jgi:hypothetical protein
MSDTPTQRFQIIKSKRDAVMDLASLAVFVTMVYFVMNPDKYDQITDAISSRLGKVSHWFSILQTKLSIQSLPETDEKN